MQFVKNIPWRYNAINHVLIKRCVLERPNPVCCHLALGVKCQGHRSLKSNHFGGPLHIFLPSDINV